MGKQLTRVIIAGSRHIANIDAIVDAVNESSFTVIEVVSGCAKGVDTLGEEWARQFGCSIKRFHADWKNINSSDALIGINSYRKYNVFAGYQRNEKMAEYADALIAVWDGKSNGTKHIIKTTTDLKNPYSCLKYRKCLSVKEMSDEKAKKFPGSGTSLS